MLEPTQQLLSMVVYKISSEYLCSRDQEIVFVLFLFFCFLPKRVSQPHCVSLLFVQANSFDHIDENQELAFLHSTYATVVFRLAG